METAPKRLWIVAGEPSGDVHSAHVIRALLRRQPSWALRGYGGPRMAEAGVEVLEDLASEAIMGLFPVIRALPRIRGWFRRAEREFDRNPPDALILTDYPGFNLRLAERAHRRGIPVIYYISPQVWAWARWRIRKIARLVDRMLVILPFEAELYRDAGLDVRFVGHPLMDHLRRVEIDETLVEDLRAAASPVVGIFPGSREHVVRNLAPIFLRTAAQLASRPGFEEARFVIALAQDRFRPLVTDLVPPGLDLRIETDRPYEVMRAANLAMTSSGTTTLEIAASETPFALAYRVSPLFYAIGRLLVSVPHIGLVNLVAKRGLVPEHVGWRDFSTPLADDLVRLWSDAEARTAQIAGLQEVRSRLDDADSYERTAAEIEDFLLARPR